MSIETREKSSIVQFEYYPKFLTEIIFAAIIKLVFKKIGV